MVSIKNSVFLNEHLADKAVIRSLTREIKRLKEEKEMSKIIKAADGSLVIAHEVDEFVATDAEDVKEATELRDKLQAEVNMLNEFTASAAAQTPVPAPAETTTQPPSPEQAAPVDPMATAPVLAPVDPQAIPAPVQAPVAPDDPSQQIPAPTIQ